MNISINLLKQIFFILIVGVLLCYRYLSIGVDSIQVLYFSVYYCFATFAVILSGWRFKSLINPISIFVPFLYLLSYSFLQLSVDQVNYSSMTFLIINCSIVIYLLFASLNYPYKPVKIFALDEKLKRKLLYFISLMAFLTFIIECIVFGYIPILNITSVDVYGETNEKLVPFLHYFIILNSLLPTWAYVFFKEKIISKKEFRLVLALSIFILLNYLSKQLYLLFGMSLFVSYTYYNDINIKKILKALGVMFLVFGLVGFLRFDSDLSMSVSEFYRAISGIENEKVSLFEAVFVEYSSKRFSILDDMVNYSDRIAFLGYGMYTFRPFTSFFLLEKTGFIIRIPELNSEQRVGTFLIDPYLDFGLVGVFILNGLYGYLAVRYYNQFRKRYPEAIVKFTIIVFCILMGMFVNYFNSMLIWLGLIINKILVGGLKSKKMYL
ncbi:O-antigen polymerase [Flavobacterium sp. LHD-85]|uniref:O-antigen polymerase n=1 Tax=Flavobacterium sp. LHD-85 TaxID=3071410 RepID=UPI0027E173F3|nr:O-antigen polymerase [Flavobacterium sp. LHD-85]MDQ6529600.1 O-antigen polymerase [Flavobacterium sp. LHD-85]